LNLFNALHSNTSQLNLTWLIGSRHANMPAEMAL
jgi:hypothetical protein